MATRAFITPPQSVESEAARGLRDALDVLAEAAERSAAAIADFVEHDLEAKKIADAARGAA